MKMNTKIINLGCRLNAYESEVIRDILEKNNINNTVVVNTCAVTNLAVKKSKQIIKKVKKERPNDKILVTGCASQIEKQKFIEMKEVDRVIDNKCKTNENSYKYDSFSFESEIKNKLKHFPHIISKLKNKTRALLQIQQGCDHRCTFCIIPFGRGESVSLPIGEIVERANTYIESGYKEIVITGVDITSYGNDLPGKPKLGEIIKRLLALVPNLKRLRFSSIDPAEMDADLIDLICNDPRLLPHIHFSVQSGDNMILKRMKRRHSRTDVIEICKRIKKKRESVTFGADFISGFPTESTENHKNTLDLINKCNFTNLHIFPFSPKKGTPASRMPQVEEKIKIIRASQLRELGKSLKLKYFNSKVGKTSKILFESNRLSYSDDFLKVFIPDINTYKNNKLKGKLVKVKFYDYDDKAILAKLV